jgi:hypothetical protein
MKRKLNLLVLVAFALFGFVACSDDNPNEPDDSNLLLGTEWVNDDLSTDPNLADFGFDAESHYLFTTNTAGVWKATLDGADIPSSETPFSYSYKDNKITITYGNGKQEVGTIDGNSMRLNKEQGLYTRYTKL